MRRSLVALALAVTLPLPGLAGQVTVKEGETLSQIAERNGISLSRLMQLNGIRNADQVEAGQTLTLPGGGGGTSQASRAAAPGTVIVKPGETLSEIAERHGLGLSQLMQINGIRKADQVEAGQTLRLRAAGQPPARTATAAAPTYPRGAKEHVVRPGESLSEIADGYGVGMSKLIAINSISDPNHVETGTRLKLKGTPPPAPAPAAATRPAAPTPRPAVTTATSSAAATRPATPTPRPAAAAVTRPAPTTRPATAAVAATASRPDATTPRPTTPAVASATPAATKTTVAMASPDWRSYGPLQVNWSAWQPMGGSMVAPSLNGQGQTQYVAINCGARKFNSTSAGGAWQSWNDPSADYEQQLVSDYCRSRS